MLRTIRRPLNLYVLFISAVGVGLIGWGVTQLPQFEPRVELLLLLAFAVFAQNTASAASVAGQTSISYAISPALSMAAVGIFGPLAGVLVETAANVGVWLARGTDRALWKRSASQLGFNLGNSVIAIAVSGYALQLMVEALSDYPVLAFTIPWLVAAVLNSQINLWLLIVVVRLQVGDSVHPWAMWKENLWATQIGVVIMGVGGVLLTIATDQFGWMGLAFFFLPILVSAYAFRLYLRRMQEHLDNLESIIAQRTEELHAVNREKDAFLAVLTHDMKTPLTSIGLYTELIRRRPQVVVEKPHVTEIIQRSQQTLLDLVNNILDLEHLQAGGALPLTLEHLDLGSLLEYLIETVSPEAQNKEITLLLEPPKHPVIIDADRVQIERLAVNLVSNAIKYTPEGGTIRVCAEERDDAVEIVVSDNGFGIPADDLPHIFERFRRVASHSKLANGTGLGLAVCQAIAEAHGGTIGVTSEENVGSTFTVRLPVVAAIPVGAEA